MGWFMVLGIVLVFGALIFAVNRRDNRGTRGDFASPEERRAARASQADRDLRAGQTRGIVNNNGERGAGLGA